MLKIFNNKNILDLKFQILLTKKTQTREEVEMEIESVMRFSVYMGGKHSFYFMLDIDKVINTQFTFKRKVQLVPKYVYTL